MTIHKEEFITTGKDTTSMVLPRPMCPLTGELLPEYADLEVAKVYSTAVPFLCSSETCSHTCSLVPLVASLQQSNSNCPVCQSEAVTSICDAISSPALFGELRSCNVVAFCYGKQNYWLAVPHSEEGAAQARIAHALGKDVNEELKILHKGKLIYPNSNESPQETSKQLLEISLKEAIQGKKKPSLVVMGARAGRKGAQAGRPRK